MFGRILSAEPDIEIAYASNGVEALDRMATFVPDVVTLDIDMPEMTGFSCLDRIMIERPCPTVIVSSPREQAVEWTLDALHRGAVDFVLKPDGALSLYIDTFAPELLRRYDLPPARSREPGGGSINTSDMKYWLPSLYDPSPPKGLSFLGT